INYKSEDFAAVIKEKTGGAGVNVILDMVAGDYTDRNLASLAIEGRLVQIATLKGPKVTATILPIMLKRLTFTASTLRAREVAFKAHIARNLRDLVWPLLDSGRVRPTIDSEHLVHNADEAHRRMESSEHIGKLVLTMP